MPPILTTTSVGPAQQRIERPLSLKDTAYRQIKGLLLSGQLQPDQLYSAQHFADQLGVSRTPAREALLQLASEGLLVCREVRGFQVREFSTQEIHDIIDARQVIEAHVIGSLVGRLTAEDLDGLKQYQLRMIQHAKGGSTVEFLEADRQFHLTLVRLTGNALLVSFMEHIRNHVAILRHTLVTHSGRLQEILREHRVILEALERKDKRKAVQAMRRHLATTERHLLGNGTVAEDA